MDKLQLPTSQIVKLVKEQAPSEVSLSSETKKSFNHATALFMLYLASAAKEQCIARKRSTIMGDDVLNAIVDLNLDWDHISGPLSDFVDQYREEKSQVKRRRLDDNNNNHEHIIQNGENIALNDEEAGSDDQNDTIQHQEESEIDEDEAILSDPE